MNHFMKIMLVLGLPIAALLFIVFLTESTGPYARMDIFIAETVHSALGRKVEIEQYMEAGLPQHYQREMSKVLFGTYIPYSMTQQSDPGRPSFVPGILLTTSLSAPNLTPLPYPPENLWCVRLKSADPSIPKVVLVALHQDIYGARWKVHEPNDVDAVLKAIGCKFSTP